MDPSNTQGLTDAQQNMKVTQVKQEGLSQSSSSSSVSKTSSSSSSRVVQKSSSQSSSSCSKSSSTSQSAVIQSSSQSEFKQQASEVKQQKEMREETQKMVSQQQMVAQQKEEKQHAIQEVQDGVMKMQVMQSETSEQKQQEVLQAKQIDGQQVIQEEKKVVQQVVAAQKQQQQVVIQGQQVIKSQAAAVQQKQESVIQKQAFQELSGTGVMKQEVLKEQKVMQQEQKVIQQQQQQESSAFPSPEMLMKMGGGVAADDTILMPPPGFGMSLVSTTGDMTGHQLMQSQQVKQQSSSKVVQESSSCMVSHTKEEGASQVVQQQGSVMQQQQVKQQQFKQQSLESSSSSSLESKSSVKQSSVTQSSSVSSGGEKKSHLTQSSTTISSSGGPEAVSEESQTGDNRKTVVRQEAATYEEKVVGKFRQIQLQKIPSSATGILGSTGVTGIVRTPSGLLESADVTENLDGTVSLKYDPKEEGLHEISLTSSGEHLQGSPYFVFVDSLTGPNVTAYGPGLSHGIAGSPCNFMIDTRGSKAYGGLQVAVEGASRSAITCTDNKDGTISVTYLPETPGEYRISVRFSEVDIKGSPFVSKITGEGRKRMHISLGASSEVSLKISEKDIRNLTATIVTPGGTEEACIIKKLPNGTLGVSFTPRNSGQHFVNVKRANKHVAGSPFMINVLEREIGDATKVRVTGATLKEGRTHVDNEFLIDTKESGYGGLSISVEGPSKAEIQCKDMEDGTLRASYRPTEPGYYIINLKFADQHVPGSPYTVKVSGQGSNLQKELVRQERDALPVTDVGCECKLTFKMRGTSIVNMSARVTSPSGRTEDARVTDMTDYLYGVQFVPKEVGVHTVSVRYKDIHIPGSPFQFTVGPLRDYGAHRVHAGGTGLERGTVKEPCEFNVWTREAGAGSLSLSVEGPSKAEIDFKDRKDGSCYVSYRVTEAGEYRVSVKFNDQHIPDSPFRVYIMPQVSDAKKIEVGPLPPESQLHMNIPVTLLIKLNGASGHIDAKVVSPNGVEDDCFVSRIDDETSALRFIPRENGVHAIHIRFNGIHIPLSPFRLRVGRDDVDPGAVRAYGPGLDEVYAGVKTEFTIETCNAGHGNLAVTVDGPAKVTMDCTEVEEGYKVRYAPPVPGEYYITVKYNAYHIAGSPFRVRCSPSASLEGGTQILPVQSSFPSKVTVSGIGLSRALVNRQNTITVNCSQAGSNALFAAMFGPSGPTDLNLKHVGGNVYTINYTIGEKGIYTLQIKWGDEHIPGSPFRIEAA